MDCPTGTVFHIENCQDVFPCEDSDDNLIMDDEETTALSDDTTTDNEKEIYSIIENLEAMTLATNIENADKTTYESNDLMKVVTSPNSIMITPHDKVENVKIFDTKIIQGETTTTQGDSKTINDKDEMTTAQDENATIQEKTTIQYETTEYPEETTIIEYETITYPEETTRKKYGATAYPEENMIISKKTTIYIDEESRYLKESERDTSIPTVTEPTVDESDDIKHLLDERKKSIAEVTLQKDATSERSDTDRKFDKYIELISKKIDHSERKIIGEGRQNFEIFTRKPELKPKPNYIKKQPKKVIFEDLENETNFEKYIKLLSSKIYQS